jgi:hypothetical protein
MRAREFRDEFGVLEQRFGAAAVDGEIDEGGAGDRTLAGIPNLLQLTVNLPDGYGLAEAGGIEGRGHVERRKAEG